MSPGASALRSAFGGVAGDLSARAVPDWRRVVDERVSAKTRRFHSAPKPREPAAAANRFAPVAAAFFYPLLRDFDMYVR